MIFLLIALMLWVGRMMSSSPALTYDAEDMARLLDISTWQVYEHCRKGDFPFEPLRVGRLLRWPRSIVDHALGVSAESEADQDESNAARESAGPEAAPDVTIDSPMDLDEMRRIASELGHPMVATEGGGWTFGNMPPEGSEEFRTVQKRVLEALGFRQ